MEVTGGSSRVPSIIAILKDFFKKDPSRTLNATEVISRGCALNCAMLSPIFRSGRLPEPRLYSSSASLNVTKACAAHGWPMARLIPSAGFVTNSAMPVYPCLSLDVDVSVDVDAQRSRSLR